MNIIHLIKEAEKNKPSPVLQKQLASAPKRKPHDESRFPKDVLKEKLTPMQYWVTQEKGTEKPFSGEYVNFDGDGIFSCVVCGNLLFSSDDKMECSSGWPSFNDVIQHGRVALSHDTSDGQTRIEVSCARCSAHLGHVFDDGHKSTGLRYCVNSSSITFHRQTHL